MVTTGDTPASKRLHKWKPGRRYYHDLNQHCKPPATTTSEVPQCTATQCGHFSRPGPHHAHHQNKTGGSLVGAPRGGLRGAHCLNGTPPAPARPPLLPCPRAPSWAPSSPFSKVFYPSLPPHVHSLFSFFASVWVAEVGLRAVWQVVLNTCGSCGHC